MVILILIIVINSPDDGDDDDVILTLPDNWMTDNSGEYQLCGNATGSW